MGCSRVHENMLLSSHSNACGGVVWIRTVRMRLHWQVLVQV